MTQEYSRLGAQKEQKPSKFQRCEMGIVLHIQSQLNEGNKKSPLTLSVLSNINNNKVIASQQSVLTPHRNQKSILSCISSSPSHQHLNGCVVNPLKRRKKEKYTRNFFCPHFSFIPYCKRRIKESQPNLSPGGPGSVTQSQHYPGHFVTKSCPATCPLLQFHLSCHYKC